MIKVVLLDAPPGKGRARFRVLEGEHEGKVITTSWDPATGELSALPGDIVDMELLSSPPN